MSDVICIGCGDRLSYIRPSKRCDVCEAVGGYVPDGWGIFGIRGNTERAEVWLMRLPIPDDLPQKWPETDNANNIIGVGESRFAAITDATRKVGG